MMASGWKPDYSGDPPPTLQVIVGAYETPQPYGTLTKHAESGFEGRGA